MIGEEKEPMSFDIFPHFQKFQHNPQIPYYFSLDYVDYVWI